MSTLSFQDYVRERMLKRRQAALQSRAEPVAAANAEEQLSQRFAAPKAAPIPEAAAAIDLGADLVHRPVAAPAHDEHLAEDWAAYQAEAAAVASAPRAAAPFAPPVPPQRPPRTPT